MTLQIVDKFSIAERGFNWQAPSANNQFIIMVDHKRTTNRRIPAWKVATASPNAATSLPSSAPHNAMIKFEMSKFFSLQKMILSEARSHWWTSSLICVTGFWRMSTYSSDCAIASHNVNAIAARSVGEATENKWRRESNEKDEKAKKNQEESLAKLWAQWCVLSNISLFKLYSEMRHQTEPSVVRSRVMHSACI